jgi:proteic killer suppression protein
MIKSFKRKEAEKIYQGRYSKRMPKVIQRLAARKLEMLAAASKLQSLRIPPSNRLEKLKGDRAGQHSLRINDQWRICFIWKAGDAHEVEIVDYH